MGEILGMQGGDLWTIGVKAIILSRRFQGNVDKMSPLIEQYDNAFGTQVQF